MASQGSQRPCLTGLSLEVISRILDYIDPPSHVDYLHEKYAVSSDLDPLTVPTLLRSALGIKDPFMAWHVRTFEVWGLRSSWADWKTFAPESDILIPVDGESISWTFTEGERRLVFDHFSRFIDVEAAEEAQAELDQGRDGAIKMLLITVLPRLNDLKFVRRPSLPHQTTALTWLERCLAHEEILYAPDSTGLASVRSVAVNVSGGPSSAYNATAVGLFMDLLLLPSLRDIYMANLEDAVEYRLPRDCSSVEHIFIDGAQNFEGMESIGLAPRALISMTIRGDWRVAIDDHLVRDVEDLVRATSQSQGMTLESLMLYNSGQLHGYREQLYDRRAVEGLARGPLRQLGIGWEDVRYNFAVLWATSQDLSLEKEISKSLKTALPAGIEAIIILGDWADEEQLNLFERALIELIQDGEHEKLKAIYVDLTEFPSFLVWTPDGTHESNPDWSADTVWFDDLVALGRERGIDVHTHTNRHEPRQHKLSFPAAKDKFDLASSPWYVPNREDDDGWEVDVKAGVWRRKEAVVQQEK